MADSDVKIRLSVEGVETIGKLQQAIREANKELAALPTDNKAAISTLGKQISATKDYVADLKTETLSSNAKMKESYFVVGEEMRSTYREARTEARMFRFAVMEGMHALDGLTQSAEVFAGAGEGAKKTIDDFTKGLQSAGMAGLGVKFAMDAIGGSMAKFAGPVGVAVFLVTELANMIKLALDNAQKVENFNVNTLGSTRQFGAYGNTLDARSMDLPSMSEKRLRSELQTHSAILMEVDRKRKAEEDTLALMKDQGKESDDIFKVHQENASLLNKQYNDEFKFIKSIGDEEKRRRGKTEKWDKDSGKRREEALKVAKDQYDLGQLSRTQYLDILTAQEKTESSQLRQLTLEKERVNLYHVDRMNGAMRTVGLQSSQSNPNDLKAQGLSREGQGLVDAATRSSENLINKNELKQRREMIALWKEENQTATIALNAMSAGLDSFAQTQLLVTRQAKDGWDAVGIAIENSVINGVVKLGEKLAEEALVSAAIGDAAQTAAVASAEIAGAAIASAYAPAALAVSIASFGTADIAAAGGMATASAALIASMGAVKAFGDGGWINEPVYGVGKNSGSAYLLGERGPEFVHSNSSMTSMMNQRGSVGDDRLLRAVQNLNLSFEVSSLKTSVQLQGASRIRNTFKY